MLKDPINVISNESTNIIGCPKDFKEIKQKYESIIVKNQADFSKITATACPELGRSYPIFQAPPVQEQQPSESKPVQANPEVQKPSQSNPKSDAQMTIGGPKQYEDK